MKPMNPNKANLLLLFTRDPLVKLVNKELEYYSSEDDSLIGFVSLDIEDNTFHAMLFDRDSRKKYCLVSMELDFSSIEKARIGLSKLMEKYEKDEESLRRDLPAIDLFTPTAKPKQRHPSFDKLVDNNGFFVLQNRSLKNCHTIIKIGMEISSTNSNLKMVLMLEYGSYIYGVTLEKKTLISIMIMMHLTSL